MVITIMKTHDLGGNIKIDNNSRNCEVVFELD